MGEERKVIKSGDSYYFGDTGEIAEKKDGSWIGTGTYMSSSALGEVPETPQVDYDAMYDAMSKMYERISSTNMEKFKEAWPESIQQGIAAGRAFDEASRIGLGDINQFNRDTADQYNWWLANTTSAGNSYMRREAGTMNKWMMGQVSDVNAFNSEEFYKALEKAMPGIMDTAGSYRDTVNQMLSGELPDSVKREIAQAGAERGLSAGVYGPSLDNAQLRDLGIERLAYLQAGQAQMPTLMGVTQGLMAPVATPNIYQNVMLTPTPYTPSPVTAQQTSYSGLGQNYLAALMGQTMMQPTAALQQVGNMASISAQINTSNTQLQYAKALSSMNYDMDQQKLAAQQAMYDKQMSVARQGQWLGLAGSILGAGAQAGTSLGIAGMMGAFSSRDFKKNIQGLNEEEQAAVAKELLATRVVTYHYNVEPDERRKHIGVIVEESPDAIVTDDKKMISIPDVIGMLLATVKTQERRIKDLEQAIKE